MMNAQRAVKDEPIPGYRLLEPLGRGGFGEVWKCEAPGGLCKAIKFVKGNDNVLNLSGNGAAQELRALQYVKSIRHPFLLGIERVEIVEDGLLIVMELADRSLYDVLEENRRHARPGVPRKELLAYLHEAAEVLDLMNQEYGLQHLDVKPRNLFLVGRHLKVGDFGLVNSLAELCAEDGRNVLGGITPLYAAPETFEGRVTLFSDQYSLAVSYHELLTGKPPIKAPNVRKLAFLVSTAAPDLDSLSETDRPIVARALSKKPRERYPSCTAFVEALISASPGSSSSNPVVRASNTSAEATVGDLSATPLVGARGSDVVPTPGSGLYRRVSRVVPAIRQSASEESDGLLPGYQFQECLGRGPTGEVWRGRDPFGQPCLVRFLTSPGREGSEGPLARLLALRHDNLPGLEVVALGSERLALISEAGESTLFTRLKECQAAGQPGIPRAELLGHLARAADALDRLYHQYQLQHLTLTPRHLAFSKGQLILLDFGLAELLWLPDGVQPATLNPRYSAAELFDGLISDACDQYSLALMYQELLVGLHPLRHLNARQMASPRLRGQPDVSLLPGSDRPIVLQALCPEPDKRFRSCREFILALEEAMEQPGPVAVAPSALRSGAGSSVVRSLASVPGPAVDPPPGQPPAWRTAIDELVNAASRGQEIRTTGMVPYRFVPGSLIEHRCCARLVQGMARLKLDGFREQWQADLISRSESRQVMEVQTTGSLLQRCLGRVPGLVVDVQLGTVREAGGNQGMPIRITLKPSACARGKGERLLAEMGPVLLESLQTHLHSQSERSAQERYPLAQVVHVQVPATGQSLTGQLRDIGREGLCLNSPSPLPLGAALLLALNRWASPLTVEVSGWVRDCFACEGQQFEIEVSFGR
jgi:serine/threonine protein kinase